MKYSKNKILTILLLIAAFITAGQAAETDAVKEWDRILDLRGQWKFELGDNLKWSYPAYDDSEWENIFVPAAWEDEGFPGYDGFAWYRIHFSFNRSMDKDNLYLRLGYIDDVDEVYINGHFLGYRGTFPPKSITAYHNDRIYYLPRAYLNTSGENVIAVRVYDSYQVGGIVNGEIGIYRRNSYLFPDFDLSGTWKFRTGDETGWDEKNFDDSDWQDVLVPAYWASYDLKEYDGHGWYRKTFQVPENLMGERLILLLGKIDDIDEVYLNGHKIGQSGRIYHDPDRISVDDNAYLRDRAYTIPASFLSDNGINQIAVRVYDRFLHGGIYDGPVGLVTREHYMDWERTFDRVDSFKDFFQRLFDN